MIWRDEITWVNGLPTKEGMHKVKTRSTGTPAGDLEVRWYLGSFHCWIDGRWYPVLALASQPAEEDLYAVVVGD